MPGKTALFALAALLLAVPVVLAQVPPQVPVAPAVPAQEPLAEPAGQIEAKISAVDMENKTITLSTAEGEEIVLNVTDSTKVTRNGMEELGLGSAGIEQVKEGDMVSVSYDAEGMEALSIDVLPAEEAVAQPREQAENETQTTVPAEEPIVEEPVMQPEKPVAEEPVATEPVETAEEETGNVESVEGIVSGINMKGNIIVLKTSEGDFVVFRLADNTSVISADGSESSIDELSNGAEVSVSYDKQTKNAIEIAVLSAEATETAVPQENLTETVPAEEPIVPEPAEETTNVSAQVPEAP